jgi:hypothetical protein
MIHVTGIGTYLCSQVGKGPWAGLSTHSDTNSTAFSHSVFKPSPAAMRLVGSASASVESR